MKEQDKHYKKKKIEISQLYISYLLKNENKDPNVLCFCKAMKINRSTFYSNFNDLWELQDFIYENYKEELNSFYNSIPEGNSNLDDFLPFHLSFIKDHASFYKVFGKYSSYDKGIFHNKRIETFILESLNPLNISMETKGYLYQFQLYGLRRILAIWINNDCNPSIPEMVSIIHECLSVNLN
jgi:hypothetical protein